MDIITARFNVAHAAAPSASTFFSLSVNGPVVQAVSVLCPLSTYDPSKSGVRITDKGGRQIYPALGQTDAAAALAGRGGFAPLMPLSGGVGWIDLMDDELSGPDYGLKFECYNDDTADFIVLAFVRIGQDLRPLAARVVNFEDLIQPIGGLIQGLVDRVFPKA